MGEEAVGLERSKVLNCLMWEDPSSTTNQVCVAPLSTATAPVVAMSVIREQVPTVVGPVIPKLKPAHKGGIPKNPLLQEQAFTPSNPLTHLAFCPHSESEEHWFTAALRRLVWTKIFQTNIYTNAKWWSSNKATLARACVWPNSIAAYFIFTTPVRSGSAFIHICLQLWDSYYQQTSN